MNNISFWSARFSTTLKYLRFVKVCRFASATFTMEAIDNLEMDFMEKVGGKKEKCVNEVKLMGRVGKDPILVTKKEKSYVKFTLATNTNWKNNESDSQKTDWHTIMVFDPDLVNSTVKYIRKGQRLYLSGKLNYIYDNDSSNKFAYILLQSFISVSS